jgi:hypothetical protein
MHTRLTKEGRAARSAFAKVFGWIIILLLALGGVVRARDSVSGWWRTLASSSKTPTMVASEPRSVRPSPAFTPPLARPARQFEPVIIEEPIQSSGQRIERRFEFRWPWKKAASKESKSLAQRVEVPRTKTTAAPPTPVRQKTAKPQGPPAAKPSVSHPASPPKNVDPPKASHPAHETPPQHKPSAPSKAHSKKK